MNGRGKDVLGLFLFLSSLCFSIRASSVVLDLNFPIFELIRGDDENALGYNAIRHRIIFLHVGKTGGSTVKAALRIKCSVNKWQPAQRSACQSQMNNFFVKVGGENAISKHVVGYSHVDVHPTEMVWKSANTFLFSIRSPIVRFISWYDSIFQKMCLDNTSNEECVLNENKDNEAIGKGILECFPNGINSLAQNLTANPVHPEHYLCWKLAWQIFEEKGSLVPSWMWHINPFNYYHYISQSVRRYPQNKVYAIRTENIWNDFSQIDSILGGNGTGYRRIQINQGKRIFALSREGRKNLCCALWNEIVIFEEILRRAMNVNQSAYLASMRKMFRDCGEPMHDLEVTSNSSLLQTWPLSTKCIIGRTSLSGASDRILR
jgi:Sulfotransferase family